MNNLNELLTFLKARDVKLQIVEGKIRYKDPNKVIKGEVLQAIKQFKQDIIALHSQNHSSGELSKHAEGQAIKVSKFQSSFLFSELLTGENEYINLPLCFAFDHLAEKEKRLFDATTLTSALKQLVAEEPTLRLGYKWQENVWQCQLNEAENADISSIEMNPDEFAHVYGDVDGFCTAHLSRKFAFDGKALFNAVALDVKQDGQINQTYLMITVHHAICDGIGLGILAERLQQILEQQTQEASAPKARDFNFIDYLGWPVQDSHKQGLAYFSEQLKDAPNVLDLPMSKVRPAKVTFAGKTQVSQMPRELTDKVNQFTASQGTTAFSLYLATFAALLRRYAYAFNTEGQSNKDVVIGVPFANRAAEHTDTMIGLFMNNLPIRIKGEQSNTLVEAVNTAQLQLREAAKYQDVSLVDIIDSVNPERNASYSPLFQVMMNYVDKTAVAGGGLSQYMYQGQSDVAKYDISMILVNDVDGLTINLEYNTDLFDESVINAMAQHFSQLLVQAINHPNQALSTLDYLSEAEKSAALEFNKTDVELPELESPAQALYRYGRAHSAQTAITFDGESLTYDVLLSKVDSMVELLQQNGVTRGDAVGLCLLRSPDLVAAIYACFAIGAHYVPLDPAYPAARVKQICEDAKPKCVLTTEVLSQRTERLGGEFKTLMLSGLPENSPAFEPVAVEQDDTAYVIFTSGTTGRPKGIEISFANLHNLLFGLDETFDNGQRQRWLAQTSVNFDISVVELIWTLSRGHSIVLQQSRPYEVLKGESLTALKPLDFSIMFFAADDKQHDIYDLFLRATRFADDNGFKAVWTPERHFAEFGGAFASPTVLASAMSTMTKHIDIRSGSVVLPLHDPIRVAEEWAMIDNLSNGRVGLSVASGWHPNDFVFQGADFANRHTQLREKVVDLKTLWQGGTLTRKNGSGHDFEVSTKPRPIQSELPLWVTAAGHPDTFKYAGEIGANMLTHMLGQNLDRLAENIAIYQKALRDNGHSVADKTVSLMLHTFIDEDHQKALKLAEMPFKAYLKSALKLLEPLAAELGMDLETQMDEVVDLAFTRFTKDNTLIGSPQHCQQLLYRLQEIGVNDIACLIDFGVAENDVVTGLNAIDKTRSLYQQQQKLTEQVNIESYRSELELMIEHRPSHVQMTPSQAKLVVEQHRDSDEKLSVEHWLLGGEPLNTGLLAELGEIADSRFYNMYGPTETTVWSSWTEVSKDRLVIGSPTVNTQFLLLDSNNQPVPVGVPGELYIGGKGVAKGYYGKPELTQERFVELEGEVAGRFYRTGDLLTLNLDNSFNYVGRSDNQVKINGYRIEQEEIEKVMTTVDSIKDAKVVVRQDEGQQNYLSGYVVQHSVVHGEFQDLPQEKQAKPFNFADGSIIYHHTDRQLGLLWEEIFEDESYFRHGIEVPENAVVFDVGANVGTFSIAVNQMEPTAQIIAFEPIPQTFSALKKNFEHRGIHGRVVNQGASDKVESVVFSYYPEMAGMSGRFADRATEVAAAEQFIANHNDVGNMLDKDDPALKQQLHDYLDTLYRSEEVDCRLTTVSNMIDELNIDAIDLLKVDVEKSECLVLGGIRDEHWRAIRQVVIEIDGDSRLETIKELMQAQQFDYQVEELLMADNEGESEFNTYVLYGHNQNFQKQPGKPLSLAGQINESCLRSVLEQQLPDYMVPKELYFVANIPLMGNGKVDMSALKSLTLRAPKSQIFDRPSDEAEGKVYDLWCEVLKKDSVALNVSFFESGGNSIDMVALHGKLQEQFEVTLSVIDLFRYTTIAQQADLVRSGSGAKRDDKAQDQASSKGQARRNARRGKRNKLEQA